MLHKFSENINKNFPLHYRNCYFNFEIKMGRKAWVHYLNNLCYAFINQGLKSN